MPGSIHVSVVDFIELPSSLPSSSILINASMGKSHHQTWGKGDFSLSMTTLRDNVSITLYDAEGNELSKAGVRIITIVEKGFVDESLSLEGGGIVHLKLRFVLNDEERNKIQRMRESAMKRKRDELLSVGLRDYKIASTARGTVMPSSCDNHEVSDPQAHVAQNEVLKGGDQAIPSREGNEALTKEVIANEVNGGYLSKGGELLSDKNHNTFDEKIETREENSTRLVDKNNEMDQFDVSNVSVTEDDFLNEKTETSIENDRGLVEKIVKEIPEIDAPKIPEKSKDVSSFSAVYLATPDVNNVGEPLEKMPSNVRELNKTVETKDDFSLVPTSRGVLVGDEYLDKTNDKIRNSGENQTKLEEQSETKLDQINFRQRPINSEDASSNTKKDVAVSEVKKHVAIQTEKREPLQKTSSSVRKMISAFESSLFKEMRPVIKPPPIKTQPEKVGPEALKDLDSEDNNKPTKLLSNKMKTPIVDEKSKPIETDGMKTQENIGFELSQDTKHLEESVLLSQAKETEERTSDTTKRTKKLLSSKVKTSLVDEKSKPIETDEMKTEKCVGTELSQDAKHLEEPSVLQTQVTETEEITKNEVDLVRMFKVEELNQNHPLNILVAEEGGCDTADIGTCESAFSSSNSMEDGIGKSLETEMKTIDSCEYGFSFGETSSAWIFPDDRIRVCTMTEIKQVKKVADEDIKQSGVYADVNISGQREPSNESSPGAETSSGLFRQAIKIAVMVAFGSVILLTRQKMTR